MVAGCGADAPTPASRTSPTGAPGPSSLELREVLEVVRSDSPAWDSLDITCIDTEGTGASGCLDPNAARAQEVVLLDEQGEAKFRLAPASITEEDVGSASAVPLGYQGASAWGVQIELTPEGATRFEALTTRLVGQQIAIVVDGTLVSAPTVAEPITVGIVQLVADMTESQARALAGNLGGA